MIEIDAISVVLNNKKILKKLSINIPKGGVVALVGPNGAGKSTLLHAMARLLPLSAGTINIDGLNIEHTPSNDIARRVAIMVQDNAVIGRLRVRELVQFGRYPHHQGHPCKEDDAIVEDALQVFDLIEIQNRFIDTLSGGQRQRVRAALCFSQGTDYLLLDEPLNNLDIFYARELMRTLKRVTVERGRTIVIVLHDLNYAATYADRIIAMRDGEIIADGTAKHIISPDTLHAIFGYTIHVSTLEDKPISLHFL